MTLVPTQDRSYMRDVVLNAFRALYDVVKAQSVAIADLKAELAAKLSQVRSARDRTIRTFHIRLRSKFCQNSMHFARRFQKPGEYFNMFENIYEIPTKFHQTLSKIQ